MLVANFMRYRRKLLEKPTHIDNFSLKKKFLFQISSGTFHVVFEFPCALFIAKHCYFPDSK